MEICYQLFSSFRIRLVYTSDYTDCNLFSRRDDWRNPVAVQCVKSNCVHLDLDLENSMARVDHYKHQNEICLEIEHILSIPVLQI